MLLYKTGIHIAALWNKKARQWIDGRKNIYDTIRKEIRSYNADNIWVHCSSLGEFEQGRPVIEHLKRSYPHTNIILTFFSPSGYEIRKNYSGAAGVFYLPMDSGSNAREFINLIKPRMAIFIKYDFWYYYLADCRKKNIPLLLVSAIFRKEQPFFQWYGTLHRKMLKCFSHLFVQDKASEELLHSIGINNVTLSGDTRFDRVAEIAENFTAIDGISEFCGGSPVLVAGSTWPADEKIIKETINDFPDLKIIIAPHEIHEEHLRQLKTNFPDSVFYSQLTTQAPGQKILIIDNIGMLSKLYHYATIAFIGGGFDKGIHNTLEAAAYGKPVLFGPRYKKFKEAIGLIETGGGISVNSSDELRVELRNLLSDQKFLESAGKKSFDFVKQNRGATERIMNMIQENRRFTS